MRQSVEQLINRAVALAKEVEEVDNLMSIRMLVERSKYKTLNLRKVIDTDVHKRATQWLFWTTSELKHAFEISRMASERLEKYFIKKVEQLKSANL